MHRSSESIGTIAAALARAQLELINPDKSLSAVIRSPFPREGNRAFRYASLSSGLEIVRKTLGKQEIATVQTTAMDNDAGLIRLTTVLAHSSGEWLSSDWPVCPITETAAPHRLGAALTYARRYALFTLVGIAGEDDLDAPDLPTSKPQEADLDPLPPRGNGNGANGALHAPVSRTRSLGLSRQAKPILAATESAIVRERLLSQIAGLASADEMLAWACASLATKNTLTASDATLVEDAFRARMNILVDQRDDSVEQSHTDGISTGTAVSAVPENEPASKVAIMQKPRRVRSKPHRDFVSSQPCLVCGRQPSDAHHLRFTQPRAMGRKVSDEFTVPLCRVHHREIHNVGDECSWWKKLNIDATEVARRLWQQTTGVSAAEHRRDADVATATPAANGGIL
jgi:hypothetical protein